MKDILLIFDMNGTVVDTEHAHWKAYEEVLKKYDIVFTLEEFSTEWTAQGKDLKDTLSKNGREDLLAVAKEIKEEKNVLFRKHSAERVTIMPGIHTLLRDTLRGEVRLALDSTSAMEDIELMLSHFDIAHVFELITSGKMEWDESVYGKSTKSSRFRYIANTLGVAHSRCVVVGDAEKDVKAAKGEGMHVIAIPNKHTRNNDFSGADCVLESACELTISSIEKVIHSN